jgi:hypothetical protein
MIIINPLLFFVNVNIELPNYLQRMDTLVKSKIMPVAMAGIGEASN